MSNIGGSPLENFTHNYNLLDVPHTHATKQCVQGPKSCNRKRYKKGIKPIICINMMQVILWPDTVVLYAALNFMSFF